MVLFIDSFLFNGEPIVKARLEFLYYYVDYFYIVESIYTFSGIKKQSFYIDTCAEWFTPYLSKIRFVKIDKQLNTTQLENSIKTSFYEEKLQRNYIRSVLLNDFKAEDYILALCDVDEIYDYRNLESKEELFELCQNKTILLRMKMYFYNFTLFLHDNWEMAFLISSNFLKTYEDLDYIRVYKLGDSTLRRISGWHFTNFMKAEDLCRKLKSFSHTDIDKPPFNNVDYLDFVVSKGIDYQQRKDFKLNKIPFEDSFHNYPKIFRKYSENIQ